MTKIIAQKIYIDEDPNLTMDHEPCPECAKIGKTFNLRYMYLNLEEAVYKCSSPDCMFPYRNFKFKNFTDQTVYKYKIISSENDESKYSNEISDTSWIESLSFSPIKRQENSSSAITSNGLDFLDVVSSDTIDRIKNSNAMDQLQSELNDILSSHVNFESDTSLPKQSEPEKIPIQIKRSTEKIQPTQSLVAKSVNQIKPKKLSKCYDFIRQKSGDQSNDGSTFKIPSYPLKDAVKIKSPKKHHSSKSSRKSHHHHHKHKSKHSLDKKNEQITENSSDDERLQAISYLNHVECFNKTQIQDDCVPITHEITPDWNGMSENSEEILILDLKLSHLALTVPGPLLLCPYARRVLIFEGLFSCEITGVGRISSSLSSNASLLTVITFWNSSSISLDSCSSISSVSERVSMNSSIDVSSIMSPARSTTVFASFFRSIILISGEYLSRASTRRYPNLCSSGSPGLRDSFLLYTQFELSSVNRVTPV
uniref:CSON009972 protein n=1 Tax=Culicoides sonorensis TaxID=179676 RepID=A0A336LKJ7_CULSO